MHHSSGDTCARGKLHWWHDLMQFRKYRTLSRSADRSYGYTFEVKLVMLLHPGLAAGGAAFPARCVIGLNHNKSFLRFARHDANLILHNVN